MALGVSGMMRLAPTNRRPTLARKTTTAKQAPVVAARAGGARSVFAAAGAPPLRRSLRYAVVVRAASVDRDVDLDLFDSVRCAARLE